MIKRFSELNNLFNLIYDCSNDYQISIKNIWIELKSKKIIFFRRNSFQQNIKTIKREIKATNFILQSEFRYFTYFVLEKVRQDLLKDSDLKLPNRLKSSYFFGTVEDCKIYLKNLYGLSFEFHQRNNLRVIEVEFKEIKSFHKFDNILLTEFQDSYHSKDFYSVFKSFLLEENSENPLYEYVFQGFYKVVRNDIKI